MKFAMKALSLAVMGVASLGMTGSVFAVCPDPTANSNQGYATPNGPWSGESVTTGATGATIAAVGGLAGTTCAMGVTLTAAPAANAKSLVFDTSPQNEPRYRGRFYVDLSHLSANFAAGNAIRLLNANANLGPAGATTAVVTVILLGPKAAPAFRFQVADAGLLGTGGIKTITINAPTPGGVNRVEFDYNTGTNSACAPGNTHGSFCAWVTDGAAASGADASPVPAAASGIGVNPYKLSADSFNAQGTGGWSGIALTNFGIFASNAGYRSTSGTQLVVLDEFDSRRQTFIGQ